MAVETLKEFLVALGFKTDEAALKKFDDGITKATKAVAALAVAVEATAVGVALMLERFSANLAGLYYQAQRVGSSARELRALDIAAQNLGANVGEASSAVESLALALATQPGNINILEAQLARLGFTVKRSANGTVDATDALLKFVQVARSEGPNAFYFVNQFAGLLGIQASTLYKLVQGDLLEQYVAALKEMGPGFDAAAKNAAKFMVQWRLIATQFQSIGADVFANISRAFGFKDIQDFHRWLQTHHQEIVTWITNAITTVITAARELATEAAKIVRKFEEWDERSGGLLGKFVALAAFLKVSGVGSLIWGVGQLGIALAALSVSAAPAVATLAAIAASLVAINAAWQALHGKSADNMFSDAANALLGKLTGGKETSLGGGIHDLLHGLLPLGIRMNNPGNLKFARQAGALQGERGFASFFNADAGLLAMGRDLEAKGARGLRSISSILAAYAPAGDNDLPGYIRDVRLNTGFGANQELNLNDPATLTRLMKAMILHEQGFNPYNPQQVSAAAAKAISIQSTIHVHGVTDPQAVKDKIVAQQQDDYSNAMRGLLLGAQ